MAPKPPCHEKYHLLHAYKDALSLFAETSLKLNAARAVTSKQEYEQIRAYLQEVQQNTDDAKLAWENHIQEHGC